MKIINYFTAVFLAIFVISTTSLYAEKITIKFAKNSLEYQLLRQLEEPKEIMQAKLAKAITMPANVPVDPQVEIKVKAPSSVNVKESKTVVSAGAPIAKTTPAATPNFDFQNKLNSQLAEQKKELDTQLAEQKEELSRYYENKLREAEEAMKRKDSEVASLKRETKKARDEVIAVKREAKATEERLKRDLLISITEAESLSNILEDFNRATLGQTPIKREPKKQEVAKAEPPQPPKNVDLPILIVSVDKANLRTGPGVNNAPLMALAKGSRLVVEKRSGEWFRVIAPNGVRAWIASEVTEMLPSDFGDDSNVRVSGYQADAEQRALRILRSGR